MSDIGEQKQDILGSKFHDPITGYVGVATSVTYYTDGQVRVCLETLVGGKPESAWFDRSRIKRFSADAL